MNFLAHIYLSGDNDEIKIGNFIGDWIKGNSYNNFSYYIKEGAILHREIDAFTDLHQIYKKSNYAIKEVYGKYSGIVADIFYDHFLAINWEKYSKITLNRYSRNFYGSLFQNYKILPQKVKNIVPFFVASNRLTSYFSISGIENVLLLMSNYSGLPEKSKEGIELLKKRKNEFIYEFDSFFQELQLFSQLKLVKIHEKYQQ